VESRALHLQQISAIKREYRLLKLNDWNSNLEDDYRKRNLMKEKIMAKHSSMANSSSMSKYSSVLKWLC
jgi:hypothetical protein